MNYKIQDGETMFTIIVQGKVIMFSFSKDYRPDLVDCSIFVSSRNASTVDGNIEVVCRDRMS